MNVVKFSPHGDCPDQWISLQRHALEEVSRKLGVAQKACRAVCELLQTMMELAEMLEHMADHPTHVAASRIDLARVSVQRKLIALSVLHKELGTD
jgi:hypothetical protein